MSTKVHLHLLIPLVILFGIVQVLNASEIVGTIRSADGETVSGARIAAEGKRVFAVSDTAGRFSLVLESLPAEIKVSHPDFLTQRIQLQSTESSTFNIELVPKQLITEEIVVTARLPQPRFSPAGSAASMVELEAVPVPEATLTSLISSVPGVAPNGQGGLFQTYSIRGISRHRVLTTVGGARITSDRRAGVSASFLDSFLMDGADILRGASSSFYGSGALGGAVDIRPRAFRGWDLATGYQTIGNENYLAAGWGDSLWSIGFVRRQSWNATDPQGQEVNSRFTQYSSVINRNWESKDHRFELLLIPTYGADIGKVNTDFPDKTTIYPRERHLIARFRVESQNLWNFEAFLHPQDLNTRQTSRGLDTNVFNDSLGIGFRGNKEFWFNSRYFLKIGADYFGRRSVDALESRESNDSTITVSKPLEGASEDELGLTSSLNLNLSRLSFETGGRLSLFRQGNQGKESISDSAWSGFAGGRFSVTESLDLSGTVSSGLRFANLSERFFTGTTGRGQIIGNPHLDSERSLSFEAGARWLAPKLLLSGFVFRNEIRSYIERIEVEPDVLTYLNLTSGVIRGVEWEGVFSPREDYQFYFRGHHLKGDDEQQRPLADIPVDRISIGFRRLSERMKYGIDWEFRSRKKNPGSGEKQIPSAQLLSAYLQFFITPSLRGSVAATNILNREYYSSADSKTPLAPGAGLSLGINWTTD